MSKIWNKLKQSKLFKDSFWAVMGNGLGTGLLLIAGILIARYLGKDVYGEYGVVKTNMFYLAGFSTFGLGLTSTRFVSRYLSKDKTQVRGIIQTASWITFWFSSFIALILIIFSNELSDFLGSPQMVRPFRFLSFIIVVKAMGTTGTGILAGLGEFRKIAFNSIASGFVMLLSCVPLTYYYGLDGSLASLSLSQVVNTVLNYISIYAKQKRFPIYYKNFNAKELISFSFPIALQEISYSVCNWAGILSLTKLSTLGEVGIYSATAQWNAVILFLPGLLHNVVLSHLSRKQSIDTHHSIVKRLLTVYLICTAIPFVCVCLLAPVITSFYGADFNGMTSVLRILTFATIPICCSDVFKSELLALGKPWLLFTIRCIKDILFVGLVIIALLYLDAFGGAMVYAIVNLAISTLFFLSLFTAYKFITKTYSK